MIILCVFFFGEGAHPRCLCFRWWWKVKVLFLRVWYCYFLSRNSQHVKELVHGAWWLVSAEDAIYNYITLKLALKAEGKCSEFNQSRMIHHSNWNHSNELQQNVVALHCDDQAWMKWFIPSHTNKWSWLWAELVRTMSLTIEFQYFHHCVLSSQLHNRFYITSW